jgi:organic hydroperoxide reductase OsmC/OhrA
MGLGFNGGQLLGLAIGGCLCNDLQYVAHDMGVSLTSVEVEVTVTLEGNPLIATHAKTRVAVKTADPSTEVNSIIRRAREISTVSNSLKRGVPVEFLASP